MIRLIDNDPNSHIVKGEDTNDIELIPLQLKPLIKLHTEVLSSGKARNLKYKVVTVPEMDQIHKDMLGVIKNLHDSSRALRRCEAMIFPLLELQSNYIP